jgi:hypothetical protein
MEISVLIYDISPYEQFSGMNCFHETRDTCLQNLIVFFSGLNLSVHMKQLHCGQWIVEMIF